jgi:hypothetical protein
MRVRTILALLLAAVVLALTATSVWRSDRRQIQRQLDALAKTASVTLSETPVERLARASHLGTFFAQDVMIHTSQDRSSFVGGRQAVVGMAVQGAAAYGSIDVAFEDLKIAVTDPSTATVYMRVTVSEAAPQGGLLEARDVNLTLSKVNGEWLVSRGEVLRTLDRPQ